MKNSIKKGFTLVELLVVMTILAVLSFLAVPQFVKMQKQANEKTFEANHRMVISAINMYVADHDGEYPDDAAFTAAAGAGVDSVANYIAGKDADASLDNGLGQPGVEFTYAIVNNKPELTSVLKADKTVDGNEKTLEFIGQ